jgi:hypothetical protein
MSAPAASDGTHFWFMSLYLATPEGFAFYRRTGTYTPNPGGTRTAAFEKLLDHVKEKSPELQGAVVVAFDMQPNAL